MRKVLIPQLYNLPEFQELSVKEQFRVLLDQFAFDISSLGIEVRSYKFRDLRNFSALSVENQGQVLRNFLFYYEIYATATREEIQLRSDVSVIWYFFGKNGWVPPADLFGHIKATDIVEVYSPEFVQLFRNLNFFRVCSHTLEDLFTLEWPRLFKRLDSDTEALISIANRIFKGELRQTIEPRVGEHLIEEIDSPELHVFRGKHRVLAPLFDKAKNPVAFVGITEAEIIGKGLRKPAQPPLLEIVPLPPLPEARSHPGFHP